MGLFDWMYDHWSCTVAHPAPDLPAINPATGLPMTGPGLGGLDVGGSPYGMDIHACSSAGVTTDTGGFEPFN
jgi:hypothetical protein